MEKTSLSLLQLTIIPLRHNEEKGTLIHSCRGIWKPYSIAIQNVDNFQSSGYQNMRRKIYNTIYINTTPNKAYLKKLNFRKGDFF